MSHLLWGWKLWVGFVPPLFIGNLQFAKGKGSKTLFLLFPEPQTPPIPHTRLGLEKSDIEKDKIYIKK